MASSLKERILSSGLIAICRRIYGDDLLRLADALYQGGIRQIEVTFDQSDENGIEHTAEAIRSLRAHCPDMDCGAGTVLNCQQVDAAKAADGTFIVAPNTDVSVIRYAKSMGMVAIPGAMTPSEIMTADAAGADIIKLFPAGWLGIPYIQDITAPISHLHLLATGGVTTDNFADFLRAGCCGAGLGGTLCDSGLIRDKNWSALQQRAETFSRVFHEVMQK